MAGTIKAQGLMFARTIEDPKLEAALGTIKDAREDQDFKAQVRALNKAKKVAKERMGVHGLKPGEWVQVGSLALFPTEREGGDFFVDAWTSLSPAGIETAK